MHFINVVKKSTPCICILLSCESLSWWLSVVYLHILTSICLHSLDNTYLTQNFSHQVNSDTYQLNTCLEKGNLIFSFIPPLVVTYSENVAHHWLNNLHHPPLGSGDLVVVKDKNWLYFGISPYSLKKFFSYLKKRIAAYTLRIRKISCYKLI